MIINTLLWLTATIKLHLIFHHISALVIEKTMRISIPDQTINVHTTQVDILANYLRMLYSIV